VEAVILTFTGLGRPLNINRVYGRMGYHARSDAVLVWRRAARELAEREHLGALDRVRIHATPVHANRRNPSDVGACLPSVKAVIDGLVDAAVLPGDGPEHVVALTFHPVVIDSWDGLSVCLVPHPHEGAPDGE
jgi:hypothetical protein